MKAERLCSARLPLAACCAPCQHPAPAICGLAAPDQPPGSLKRQSSGLPRLAASKRPLAGPDGCADGWEDGQGVQQPDRCDAAAGAAAAAACLLVLLGCAECGHHCAAVRSAQLVSPIRSCCALHHQSGCCNQLSGCASCSQAAAPRRCLAATRRMAGGALPAQTYTALSLGHERLPALQGWPRRHEPGVPRPVGAGGGGGCEANRGGAGGPGPGARGCALRRQQQVVHAMVPAHRLCVRPRPQAGAGGGAGAAGAAAGAHRQLRPAGAAAGGLG